MISQLITLYLTPVVYTYLASIFKTRKIPAATADQIAAHGMMQASGLPDNRPCIQNE